MAYPAQFLIADANLTMYHAKYNYTTATAARSLVDIIGTALDARSKAALITIEDQSVRYTSDGTTTVTTSVGILLAIGGSVWFTGSLANFRLIQTSATAKINVEIYG